MAYTLQVKGGNKINQVLSDIFARASKRDIVNVGFLENSTYPDGTSVPTVAALNEFGVPAHHQPPRPFFRTMIAEKSPDWGKRFAVVLKSTKYDAAKSLDLMGEGISNQLRQAIESADFEPLAPSTIKRKGNSKQLVDTGYMLSRVDYEVK